MKIKKLFKDIEVKEIKGSKEIEITGISSNSRVVGPGHLFIAKKGRTVDGAKFIPNAIEGGAVAILTDMYDPTFRDVTQIIYPDVASIEGVVVAQFYQQPSHSLLTVGVTGTNGKTTTSYLLRYLLDQFYGPCGQIGTIEYILGAHRYPATHTTPEVTTNHKMLREMVNYGCRSVVMEVTSHALDQKRVDQIAFDIAIFTNLSPEHLDYHKTMENYCKTKNLLFRGLGKENIKKSYQSLQSLQSQQTVQSQQSHQAVQGHQTHKNHRFPKLAIVNVDDPYYQQMIDGCKERVITYGIMAENKADLQATDIKLTPKGTALKLKWKGGVYSLEIPLVGRFNVYNALAALATMLGLGLSMKELISFAESFPAVPGRIEVVPNDQQFKVYVDFAHTPDALENVLKCLAEFKAGRILTVFGCGGDRDKTKRPVMAKISENYSDQTIVTSDNPRSEDPEVIISEITKGFTDRAKYLVEPDRREAIKKVIQMATPNDIVLIAGRGHEPYQQFGHYSVEFDDRIVAAELLASMNEVCR